MKFLNLLAVFVAFAHVSLAQVTWTALQASPVSSGSALPGSFQINNVIYLIDGVDILAQSPKTGPIIFRQIHGHKKEFQRSNYFTGKSRN